MKDKKKKNSGQIALNIAFIIIAITYIAPLMMIVSASFTSERILKSNGFGLWPKEVSLDGYKAIFGDTTQVVQSYLTTITFSGLGTFLGVLIMGLTAYPLARKSFALKKPLNY